MFKRVLFPVVLGRHQSTYHIVTTTQPKPSDQDLERQKKHRDFLNQLSEPVFISFGQKEQLRRDAVDPSLLWHSACLARRSRSIRNALGTCVVGNAQIIERIWSVFGIRPNVIFLPGNFHQRSTQWIHRASETSGKPTVVVTGCDAQANRRRLLSAEHSDGVGAEFPLPLLPTLETLITSPESLKRVLALINLRIPQNVGTLIRSAVRHRFDSVLLSPHSTDLFHEKVLRASGGLVFASPNLHLRTEDQHALSQRIKRDAFKMIPRLVALPSPPFNDLDHQVRRDEVSHLVSQIEQVATTHHLLPILGVPEQSENTEGAFEAGLRLHAAGSTVPPDQRLGRLLLLGGESGGLNQIESELSLPSLHVTVNMENPQVTSLNVAAAGTILMDALTASERYDQWIARGVAIPEGPAKSPKEVLPTS